MPPNSRPRAGAFVVEPVADVAALCETLRRVLTANPIEPVELDAGLLVADLQAVHALAALFLVARRHSGVVLLRHASPELHGLLHLCGLGECLGLGR